jgi:hypothetical protein
MTQPLSDWQRFVAVLKKRLWEELETFDLFVPVFEL